MTAERPRQTLRGRSVELGAVVDALRAVAHGRPAVVRTAYSAAHEDDRVTPLGSLGPALRSGLAPLIDSPDFMDLAGLHEQPSSRS
ncbi:MAG TPA: hypothetical protein VGL80_23465 [Pseudonocardiaceae bacterium]